ncbi:MAG: glycosyltransferase family 4 protein [Acidobacteriota bacterium]
MILALQTTTFAAHGGIPVYNRLVCRALNESGGNLRACGKLILIGQDRPADVANGGRVLKNISFEAFSGNRRALMWRTLGLALHESVDLALIGHVNYAPFGLMLKRFQPQARYGVVLYGIDAWRRLPPIRRRALQKADFLIAISETTKKNAVAANELDETRVHVLPNALEWPAESLGAVPSTGKRLLSVCRLERSEQYKGVDTTLRAVARVAREIPDLHYVVVGDGSDLARHKELANELGIADRVEFTGSVSDEALRRHYRNCDVFIMPSEAEGFGFVFLEAMHYRKPIIAANSGATPEVVRNGETGLLVDYGNVDQLAAAITSLSLNADLRKRLGAAGQTRLQENFTFDRFRQRFSGIIGRELGVNAAGMKAQGQTRGFFSRGAIS